MTTAELTELRELLARATEALEQTMVFCEDKPGAGVEILPNLDDALAAVGDAMQCVIAEQAIPQ